MSLTHDRYDVLKSNKYPILITLVFFIIKFMLLLEFITIGHLIMMVSNIWVQEKKFWKEMAKMLVLYPTATLNPLLINFKHILLPIPPLPPVTKATFFLTIVENQNNCNLIIQK